MRSSKTFFERQNVFSPLTPLGFILAILCFGAIQLSAQSGTVFRDYDGDGTKDAGEPGVAGVLVKSYINGSPDVLLGSATSGATGTYTLSPAAGAGQMVRVEFTFPAATACLDGAVDYSSTSGSTYGSSVQFVTGPTAGINFAINNPGDYTAGNTNPTMYSTQFINGDPLPTGAASGTKAAVFALPYTASGTTPAETTVATTAKVGSVWGMVHSSASQKLLVSSVLRRHCGYGPSGSGGIYLVDPSGTDLVTNFIDLDALGFATRGSGAYAPVSAANVVTFTSQVGTNVERGLLPALNMPSRDIAAFEQIGKVGLGDIDISEDGRYVYVMNLFDRKLYEIDLTNAAAPVAPTTANVRSWSVPDPGCTGGTYRPWAIKVYRGKIYVGVVCDAQSSQTVANLSASIYEFNPAGAGAFGASVLSFPLNYPKGEVSDFSALSVKGWFPWTNDFGLLIPSGNMEYPQPILSDIEFDNDGSMILGFADRAAMQVGWFNYSPNTADNTLRLGFAGGDILRAYRKTDCSYELESNGKEGPSSAKAATAGAGNNEGPGGGEFYYGDNTGGFGHKEISQGGLAMLRGAGEVVYTMYDPNQFDSYGVQWLSNTTGAEVRAYELNFTGNSGGMPADGTFSKAGSMGDIELGLAPAPIEIGNRVWMDTDNDGVQDADEMGLSAVTVKLFKGATQVGQTTTTGNGNFYFNNSNVTMNGATGILPEMAYTIRIDAADFPSGKVLSLQANITGAGQSDLSDNDATTSGGNAVISLTTGKNGQNNHTYDFAFSACAPLPCGATTVVKN